MTKTSEKFIAKILRGGVTLMGLALTSQPAQAILVNVGGNPYNVTTFTGSYNDNVSKFETAANGGEMPWFGNNGLANNFAIAVFALTPRNGGLPGNFGTVGPLFAFSSDSTFTLTSTVGTGGTVFSILDVSNTSSNSYAVASAVAVPWETDALPVVGSTVIFAGAMWLKRRRKNP